jgi:hypothetical protein
MNIKIKSGKTQYITNIRKYETYWSSSSFTKTAACASDATK